MTGRWQCRQVDVLLQLDAELEEAYGNAFARLDAFARLGVEALFQDPERLREVLAPFTAGGGS